jgi:hypothetical protein
MTALSSVQRDAIVRMAAYHRRLEAGGVPQRRRWAGARELGITGYTLDALERRGLARVARIEKPYPRHVGILTSAGFDKADELTAAANR